MDLVSLYPDFFRGLSLAEMTPSQQTAGVWHLPCPGGHTAKRQRKLHCWPGRDGRLMFRCYGSCSKEQILAALGVGWDATFPPKEKGKKRKAIAVERSHEYEDAGGRVVYRKCIGRQAGGKCHGWWQRWDAGVGLWTGGLSGVECVPYRLPELLATAPRLVMVTEGEKDADLLADLGFIATTGGGKDCWLAGWSGRYLASRPVVIWPDAGEDAEAHTLRVCGSLLLAGCPSVRLHRWPEDVGEGWDVTDELLSWRAAGETNEELAERVREMVRGMNHWFQPTPRRER